MLNGLGEPTRNARRRIWRAFFLSAVVHLLGLAILSARWEPGSGVAVFLAPGLAPALEVNLLDPPGEQTDSVPAEIPEFVAEAALDVEASPVVSPRQDQPPPVATPPESLTVEERGTHDYLPAETLAEPPVPIEVAELAIPSYPGPAHGLIVIELQINESGRVDQIRTVETNVPGPFLFEVFRVFKSAQYRPGKILGKNVKASLRIEVSYQRDTLEAGRVSVKEGVIAR